MQIPLQLCISIAFWVSLATIGVCVFCAAASVAALFILGEKEKCLKAVVFFGHRKVSEPEALKKKIQDAVEKLILEENVRTFYFGSHSAFDNLAYDTVTKLKEKYPGIHRVNVQLCHPFPLETTWFWESEYKDFEDVYFPEGVADAGKASYVKRNYAMIDKSDFCIIYYDENYLPPKRKTSKQDVVPYQPNSGTKVAFTYAEKKKKAIINLYM